MSQNNHEDYKRKWMCTLSTDASNYDPRDGSKGRVKRIPGCPEEQSDQLSLALESNGRKVVVGGIRHLELKYRGCII